jgi:hypothetical protein
MLLVNASPRDAEPVASRFDQIDRDTLNELTTTLARRVHGIHASIKTGRAVPYRSLLERDLLHLLETDPSVISFQHWPEKVTVLVNGMPQPHIPAVRATLGSKKSVVLDAVSTRHGTDHTWAALASAVRRAYAERGVCYRVMNQREVRTEPRMSNVRRILEARGAHVPAATLLTAEELLSRGDGQHTVAEVEGALTGMPGARDAVFQLALHGRVDLDASAAVPGAMRARLRQTGGAR